MVKYHNRDKLIGSCREAPIIPDDVTQAGRIQQEIQAVFYICTFKPNNRISIVLYHMKDLSTDLFYIKASFS